MCIDVVEIMYLYWEGIQCALAVIYLVCQDILFLALLQVTDFWNKVLNEAERTRLVNNIAGHLKDAKQFLQKRAVSTV